VHFVAVAVLLLIYVFPVMLLLVIIIRVNGDDDRAVNLESRNSADNHSISSNVVPAIWSHGIVLTIIRYRAMSFQQWGNMVISAEPPKLDPGI
jgi:hypothetical protein